VRLDITREKEEEENEKKKKIISKPLKTILLAW
jgi:hypothetical protein